jgi:threonine synthase
MSGTNSFVCTACGKSYPLHGRDWRCECGGLFDLEAWPAFDVAQIDTTQPGLWRYQRLLPLDPGWEPVTLGEGNTPLLPVQWQGLDCSFKLESVSPTGSFKDRGTCVLVTALRGLGIERAVEDSSGNAGASLAAYTARAGITCEICVPDTAGGPKLAQMAAHGAEVIEIKGRREYAALGAWAASAHGAYYASHVHSPYFLAGLETIAFELWEQLAYGIPDAVVLPVGTGTLLYGIYRGFRRLQQAGLVERLPHLIAVQAAACAPIYQAYLDGSETIAQIAPEPSVASGVAISQPAWGEQTLAAVRATCGTVLTVTEEEIQQTRNQLAWQGFYVEDNAAVAVAALANLPEIPQTGADGPVVVLLTGHGLKIYPAA